MNIETIRHEAFLLPPKERAKLTEQLLSNLDALTKSKVEHLRFQ